MQKNFKQSRLGLSLRTARKSQAMTQAILAGRAGVSVPTVRMLECGRGNLSSWFACLSVLSLVMASRQLPQGEHIGKQIAVLRKRRCMGQRAVAMSAGITQPTLIQLGRHYAGRLNTLERILTVLGVNVYC